MPEMNRLEADGGMIRGCDLLDNVKSDHGAWPIHDYLNQHPDLLQAQIRRVIAGLWANSPSSANTKNN